MRHHVYTVILGVLLVVGPYGIGIAEQDAPKPQDSQAGMTMAPTSEPVPMPAILNAPVSHDYLVSEIGLMAFEAALGDLSMCGSDRKCLKYGPRVKAWICLGAVCSGEDKSKQPIECSKALLEEYPKEIHDQINAALCPVIESPTPEARKALLQYIPDMGDHKIVEYRAYVMAVRESSQACIDFIKDYVGPYGPQWTYVWYRALSGCRILSKERTRADEENDIKAWLRVIEKRGDCSQIVDNEMRSACETPGATSPQPVGHDK